MFELVRVSEYRTALAEGQLPPAWAPNLYHGYGSPIFLFYAPLFGFVATIFSYIFGSIPSGSVAALCAFTAIGAATMYRLVHRVVQIDGGAYGSNSQTGDRPQCRRSIAAAARVVAYLFVLNPYLLGDKLVRNANAEFAALCLLPLVLEGLLICRQDLRHGCLLVSLGLAITIVAHNLTALVAAGLLGLFSPFVLWGNWSFRAALWLIGGIALGLAMAAFFWVPAISLTSLVRTEELLSGKFDFHRNFPPLLEYITPGTFFSTGIVTLFALLLCLPAWIVHLVRRTRFGGWLYPTAVGSAIVLLLSTSASTFIWERAPFMPLFQFPWRMMGPLAVLSALAGGICFAIFFGHGRKWLQFGAEGVVLIVCIANAIPALRMARPIPDDKHRELAELLSPAGIRDHRLSATVGDEYLPRTAHTSLRSFRGARHEHVVVTRTNMSIAKETIAGTHIRLRTHSTREERLELARWWFPGWSATIDGVPADVHHATTGRLAVTVPKGEAVVDVRYLAPPVRRVSVVVSLGAGGIWAIIAFARRSRSCHALRRSSAL